MYMPCVKCSELKLAKHLHTFFVLIKLKKSRSGFELVTVLISKQNFFSTSRLAFLAAGKSHLHGIALPDFYIVSSFFYKKSKQARVPTFVWLFRDDATTAKGPGCHEGTKNYVNAISR